MQWRMFRWVKLSVSNAIVSQRDFNGNIKLQFFGQGYVLRHFVINDVNMLVPLLAIDMTIV